VDLAAARGVERRVDELDEQPPVDRRDRADLRRLLERLVAGERRPHPRRDHPVPRLLDELVARAAARARAGAHPLLVHQVLEALRVDAESLLRGELQIGRAHV
jgi:hypothetical protein